MLTQEQLNQLKPLFNHPKFGRLLKEAVKIWQREDITPATNSYGVEGNFETNKYVLTLSCCCLLGGSLVDKPFNGKIATVTKLYDISEKEFEGLWLGFDNNHTECEIEVTEAYEFGKRVNEIVKPRHYRDVYST